jgi:class 3 adenylate cyclase
MSRALEIQRAIADLQANSYAGKPEAVLPPSLRIGLHMGEFRLDEDQPQLISRHVNRAHRLMDLAGAGEIFASKVVVDAGRDYIEGVPFPHLAIESQGEHVLKGVGEVEVFALSDQRVFRSTANPSPLKVNADRDGKENETKSIRSWMRPDI